MTRDEVKEIFKVITNVYNNFDISSEKLDVWYDLLKDQKANVVMENLKGFVKENKYPPTIADIREQPRPNGSAYVEYVPNINAGEDWNAS